MPTVNFTFRDFQQLLGKKLSIEEFEDMLALYAKAEVESYDKQTDELSVKLDDTNLPYTWCPEGLARFFKGILGLQKGAAKIKTSNGSYRIIADDSVKSVRPHITAFVAKGKRIDDYLLKQLVLMQEKFCEGYGRRRQKVSVGLYAYKKIAFPVHYRAVSPTAARFVPLDFDKPMNLSEILRQHPKGQQYGWILKSFQNYPLLLDDKGDVLSFPPIINSSSTGRLEVGDTELLFEATGTDEESVNLAANIFAYDLFERGFEIFSVTIAHKGRSVKTPALKTERMKVTPQQVEQITGLKVTGGSLAALLQKAGYGIDGSYALVPPYRADIMHVVDIAEDVAIAYGFDRIHDEPMASYTLGAKDKSIRAANSLRKAAIGAGFQEVFSHILTDRKTLTAAPNSKIVEVDNFMSETYSAVRNSLIPQMLDVLSRNKHADYPQKIFEEGILASVEQGKVVESHSMALVSAHSASGFSEMKQYLSAILTPLAAGFTIRPAEYPLFIKGRAGNIIINKKNAGVIGEVSPAVLAKWGIEMPAAAVELNLDFLLKR